MPVKFGGIMGQYLDVDLTGGDVHIRRLPETYCEEYVGGRGLATRLLWDAMPADTDPLAPESAIVLATSPLVGTAAPTAGRGHTVFKSPLTGVIGSSNSGGDWAVILKRGGFDALVIRGRSPEAVVLDIGKDGPRLLPAGTLWGTDAHETSDILMKGRDTKNTRVLTIGPAGENRVRFASLVNNKNRVYGRGGPGAVFGSKNLKAVVVSGDRDVPVRDEDRFRTGLDQGLYRLRQAPATNRILRELGTAGLVRLIDVIDMLPHCNFKDTAHRVDDLNRISGEAIRKNILEKAKGCYRCPIACQRHTRVGGKEGEGPEYETVVLMGPVCGIYDLEAITLANYSCNELGLDTISYGGTVACAMELFESGAITRADTGGLDLRFGNAEALEALVPLVARREGIGDLLAGGSRRLATHFGRPDLSMSIKGLELPAYDPRASFIQALGYMTSPSGACHLRGGYAVSLAFFGGPREIPRFSVRQAPAAVRNVQNAGILQDTLGVCRFTSFAFNIDTWARMLSGVMGADFSTSRLEAVAERVANLERLFNLGTGLKPEDDTIPARFQVESISTDDGNVSIPPDRIEKLRAGYYTIRGWDEKGVPRAETLERLNLSDQGRMS